ncbi:Uncharacterised protein [Mycobacteroides abscessus subsp. abscessus]|nr:Uncharacterised protein [Mycobacteroides abscessus subsp. abscessus]
MAPTSIGDRSCEPSSAAQTDSASAAMPSVDSRSSTSLWELK